MVWRGLSNIQRILLEKVLERGEAGPRISQSCPSDSEEYRLQRSLVPAVRRHHLEVAVADLMLQRGDDLILPGKKIGAGEVDAGDRMVRDEIAVTGQVFHEELQFFEHLLLRERIELPALRFLEQGCPREQGQPARTDEHGLALAENLGGMKRVLPAVLPSGDAVEERHPVVDPGFLELVALLENILRVVAFMDPVQRPVIAALHAEGYRYAVTESEASLS